MAIPTALREWAPALVLLLQLVSGALSSLACVSDFYDSSCSRLLPGTANRLQLLLGCIRHSQSPLLYRKVDCVNNTASAHLSRLSIGFFSDAACTNAATVTGAASLAAISLNGCSPAGGAPTLRDPRTNLQPLNLFPLRGCCSRWRQGAAREN